MLLKLPKTISLRDLKPGDEIRVVSMILGGEWGATLQHTGANVVDKVTKTHVHVLIDGTYRARYSRDTGRSAGGGACVPVAFCAKAKADHDAGVRVKLTERLFHGSGDY
jgi:hypothetical protein